VSAHYISIENAFKAGFHAAMSAEANLTDELLVEILDRENLWLHDPRSENGLKEVTLKRTGSRGRPPSSGSGGNGDPASKSRGGNNAEYANKPYDPGCCARRHWNGGLCSEDGTQAGAQCTNLPIEGGEFCAKCDARHKNYLQGGVDWHGSFSKSIQEDPGKKKDGSNHPWKIPKDEQGDASGTGLEKTESKKKTKKHKKAKKPKKTKKAEEEPKAEDPKVEEAPKAEEEAKAEEPRVEE